MEHKMMQVFAAMMVFLALSFQPVLSQADISNAGCGTIKQCVQEPDSCDPADTNTNTSCLFGSARPTALKLPNGVDLAFELSGNVSGVNSSGFIAVGLTNEAQISFMLFVCAQNNGSFFSMSTIYNKTSNTLNSTNAKPMTEVKNAGNGASIKCTFNVVGLNATDAALVRAADTTYRMVVGSGTLDGNGLGAFVIGRIGNATDLSSFLNSTNTTATGGANRPFYSNAVLPLLSFLTLSILTFA